MGLIDDLAEKARCGYLSELKLHPERYPLFAAVESTPVDSYSQQEWHEAAAYLVPESNPPCDSEACKRLLLVHAQRNPSML
ncbi:hypothetical protein [Raoultibacter phocaeensis]|uniref:hypothetical protein n=1 Tax=Raoultibacter phocaeensis TaxID=2479841 RepID=UPI00111881ED|nr:hypothetical protein [Raoultibacter phocaeensis]